MRRILICLSVFFLLNSAAQAQLAPTSAQIHLQKLFECSAQKIYSASDASGAPPLLAAIFAAGEKTLQYRTCLDGENNLHYAVREQPRATPGVCRTWETEIFPSATDQIWIYNIQLKGWRGTPPTDWTRSGYRISPKTWAFVTDGECPNAFDPRYAEADSISDGMLVSFDKLWQQITASDAAFDKVFMPMSGDEVKYPYRKGERLSLRDRFVAKHETYRDIGCSGESRADINGPNDCSAWFGDHYVRFDVLDGKLTITGYGAPPVQ